MYNQFDTIFDQVLEEVGAMSGSAVIQQEDSMQIVYEAFSNVSRPVEIIPRNALRWLQQQDANFCQFVESIFELMDALTQRAKTFVNMDEYSKYGIPSEIRALSGVVDVRLLNHNQCFVRAGTDSLLCSRISSM